MRPAQVPHSPAPRCRGVGWAQAEVVFRSSCLDLLLGGALTKTPLHSDSALSSPPRSLFIPRQAGSITWQEPVMQDCSSEHWTPVPLTVLLRVPGEGCIPAPLLVSCSHCCSHEGEDAGYFQVGFSSSWTIPTPSSSNLIRATCEETCP